MLVALSVAGEMESSHCQRNGIGLVKWTVFSWQLTVGGWQSVKRRMFRGEKKEIKHDGHKEH